MQIGKYFSLKHSLDKRHFLALSGSMLLFTIAFHSVHCIFLVFDLVKHAFDLMEQNSI